MRGKDSAGRKTISLKTTQSFGNNPCKQGVPYKEPQKHPVLRNAKPSDGLLGRGQIPHGTDCCVPYDETGHSRLYAARYRNVHTRVTNILPLFQSILGANFSLFLRFKGPASKGTRIDPRVRFQGPFFKKTRPDAGLCARPLKTMSFETLNLRQGLRLLHATRCKPFSPHAFQTAHRTTNRSALSPLIPSRPLAQLIHGRAKPLPRFPCCQQPVALPNPKRPSDFLGNDHAPKLVNSAHNPRCPQCSHPP